MKKLLILPLLGLLACQPNNPQPNTSTNNGSGTNGSGSGNTGNSSNNNYIECTDTDNIPWNQNVNYGSVTDIDGNEYKTVTIGNQEWMAENLKTTHYANGDEIPYVFNGDLDSDIEWESITTGAFCWYLDTTANGDTISYENCYGGLYNFYAVEDSRNVCPTGWHVPSDDEWTELTDYLGSNGHLHNEGSALKSTEGWNDYNGQSGNGTDVYGFRGHPGSFRDINGEFAAVGSISWWCSSENSMEYALSRTLISHLDYFNGNGSNYKKVGFSVRCIKN